MTVEEQSPTKRIEALKTEFYTVERAKLERRTIELALSTLQPDKESVELALCRVYEDIGMKHPLVLWCDSPLQLVMFSSLLAQRESTEWNDFWSFAQDKFSITIAEDARQYLDMDAWQTRLENFFSMPALGRPIDLNGILTGRRLLFEQGILFLQDHWTDESRNRLLRANNTFGTVLSRDFRAFVGFFGISTSLLSSVIESTYLPFQYISSLSPDDKQVIDYDHYDLYSAWYDILRSCFWLAARQNAVFVCPRPVVSNFDAFGRWHSEDGPAVRFADGYSAFIWHGTTAASRAVLQPPTLDAIDTEVNLETRRVLIARFGLQQYIRDSGATVVSKDQYGTLYRKVERSDENMLVVHVVNKTPEPDGTFKEYFIRVPHFVNTPKQGIAWTFGLTEDEYDPQVET